MFPRNEFSCLLHFDYFLNDIVTCICAMALAFAWPDESLKIFNSSDQIGTYFSEEFLSVPDCMLETPIDTASPSPTTIFPPDSFSYLWDCAFFTIITKQFRLGRLPMKNVTYLIDNHADLTLARATWITTIISTFLVDHCDNSESCTNKHACSLNSLAINESLINMNQMNSCVESICAGHVGMEADTDIAGIGVFASYIIQAVVVLLCALLLTCLMFVKSGNSARALTTTLSETANQRKIASERISSRRQKLFDALIKILTDFHMSGCYFSISISIAALIELKLQDTRYTIDQLALVTAGGPSIFFPTLSFYILASVSSTRKSWYLYILSFITWTLGLSVALNPQMHHLRARVSHGILFTSIEYSSSCGNSSPDDICGHSWPQLHLEYTFYYTFCIPIMFGLTIWQFSCWKPINKMIIWLRHSRLLSATIHIIAIHLFVVPIYVFFKGIFILVSNKSINMTWNFGQIIAVSIWIPTIAGLITHYAKSTAFLEAKNILDETV